jgi:hypothetical protein
LPVLLLLLRSVRRRSVLLLLLLLWIVLLLWRRAVLRSPILLLLRWIVGRPLAVVRGVRRVGIGIVVRSSICVGIIRIAIIAAVPRIS